MGSFLSFIRDQIEEDIRDEELDSDPRLRSQEREEKVEEGLLAQDDPNGNPQHALRRLLSAGHQQAHPGAPDAQRARQDAAGVLPGSADRARAASSSTQPCQ